MAVPAAETRVLALGGPSDEWPALIEEELARLVGRPVRLVIDLNAARPVDATVLGLLVLASKRLERHGGHLVLVCDRPQPLDLLRRTGLERVFDVVTR